jgi:crotonobetainyl-CoA:carnitine CoA-transferase CaiB-like acyl-CoA transferase
VNGVSAYFAWLNRGKRSVVLDLKQAKDHAACTALIESADVFLHNLAPGAVERLGFGYDALVRVNPRLVWCGVSGYGPDGPLRDKKAYDMLVQAESGVVSVTGGADAPAKVGVSIADISSGMYAYGSILAALFKRERTGRGDRIDISMLECLTEWMTPALYMWQGTGVVPARVGVRHNMIVPYGAYSCADGPVLFAIQTQREWERFCAQVMGDASLATDPRFASNRDRLANRAELEAIIERRFCTAPRTEIIALLDRADIPTGSVNDVPAVVRHPQLAARGRWSTTVVSGQPAPALVPPHNIHGAPPRMGAVPSLGEHTAAVLSELTEPKSLGGNA